MQTDRIYLDGAWAASAGGGTLQVVNAASEQVIATVPDGVEADVDLAVAAARRAFEGWSATPLADRVDVLHQVVAGLRSRQQEIAETISAEMGMPLTYAHVIQVGLAAMDWTATAEVARTYEFESRVNNSLILREPVGVVGAITPWNYPLHQVSGKVAPALVTGCTVVVKPSEIAPLSAYILAEILDGIGLPPGVFNLVSGTGPVVGEALVGHPEVDMVSFTGSTRAGRRITEVAGRTIKRVTLELGGKSPFVILDDAELGEAVVRGLTDGFINSGQTCSALTRMVVPRSRLAEVEGLVELVAGFITVGDPTDPATVLGPLVSAAQRDRVRGFIRTGVEEGARLVIGGAEPPDGLPTGFYVRPTVFSDVTPTMTIAQEEIFGPVIVIQPYDDEDEAVRIANDTVYGLAAGVYSADEDRAVRFARRVRAGQVAVNGGAWNAFAPFGGYKQSGNGREFGTPGLEEFLEIKAVQLRG